MVSVLKLIGLVEVNIELFLVDEFKFFVTEYYAAICIFNTNHIIAHI